MRITTKGRYALRAVIYLVTNYAGKPISIRKLSEIACLSPEFLEQIFFRLRKAEIISSTRGPGGGFKFCKDPSKVSVDDLFIAIDEGYHIAPCSTEDPDVICERSDECITCGFWNHTYTMLRTYFSSVTIQDIIDGNYEKLRLVNNGAGELVP